MHHHASKHVKEQAKQVIVQVHKESLQAELKMVREDIHRVTLELTQHQQRVDKLHAKHDVLVSRNATPDGEVHSQVQPQVHCMCAHALQATTKSNHSILDKKWLSSRAVLHQDLI